MTLLYELNNKAKKKYNFDTLEASGWFGYYAKSFNKYWRGNNKINLSLTDNDIDFIVNNSECIEC